MAARHGITGHLDEWSPDVSRRLERRRAQGPAGDGTGWPLEQCSYWLDGAGPAGLRPARRRAHQESHRPAEPVVDGVNRGGKSFIYWKSDPPKGSTVGPARTWAGPWWPGTRRRATNASSTPWFKRLFRLPRAAREISSFDDVKRPVQYRRDAGNLCLQRRPPRARSGAGGGQLARRRCHLPPLGRMAATTPAMPYAPMKNSACPLCSILGPASRDTGKPRSRPRNGSSENNMLPYGVASGDGESRRHRRLSPDRNLRRDGRHLVHALDVSHRRRAIAAATASSSAFFNAAPAPIARDFQTMCYYQSPNRIESESLPERAAAKSPGKRRSQFTRLGYPARPLLRRRRQSHHSQVTSSTCGWPPATRAWPRRSTVPAPCRPMVGDKVPVKLTCQTAYPFEETIRVSGRSRASSDLSALFSHSRLVPPMRRSPSMEPRRRNARRERLCPHRTAMEQGRRGRAGLSHVRAARTGL